MIEATEKTGNYIHFKNDTEVDLDVSVTHWPINYSTHLKANGGTGVPYKPYYQSYNYYVAFYLHTSGDEVTHCGPVNVEHESQLVRVYTKDGQFNCEITDTKH